MVDRPLRRSLQFSLRALLALMTVFCLWLAIEVNSASRQREAVEQIRAWGGKVEFNDLDQTESYWRSWRRMLFGKDAVSQVVGVRLPPSKATFQSKAPPGAWAGPAPYTEGAAIDDEGLKIVARFGKLEYLDLSWNDISDVGLARLESLKELRSLYLYETKITSAGLSRLRGLKRLETLGVSGKSIGDEACANLVELDQLKNLVLDGATVSNDGLKLLKDCSTLRYISLARCSKVDDDGLQFLGSLSKLIEADLRETAVTAEGAAKLQQRLPNCRVRF